MKRKIIILLILLIAILSVSCKEHNNISKENNVYKKDNDKTVYSSNYRLSKDLIITNRYNLLKRIENNSAIVLFSGYPTEKIRFSPNRNFYYLTGIDRPNVILLIIKSKEVNKQFLFIPKSNPTLERWVGKTLKKEEVRQISGINNVFILNSFNPYFKKSISQYNIKNVYLDLGDITINTLASQIVSFDSPITQGQDFALHIRNRYKEINIKNIFPLIADQRLIKNKEEIQKIKKAVEITGEGIKYVMQNAKPGMKEYQLEAYFDFITKYSGAKEHAFLTIAASGENATIAHYQKNNSEIQDKELILMDLGATYGYYNSDITRTFPSNGRFTKRQKEIYNIVLKAQTETIKAVKPGITLSQLDNIAKNILSEECKRIGLINKESEISDYYFHFIGHYLGLDTHDPGDFNRPLQPGMVITIEPGLYIEEEGLGIRIEDDILVTEDGFVNLSKNIIKNIKDIETFMNKSE
ncbi:aminopeptidase P family protein [Caldisalinibacter kiritimatiensis]|uniref:Xaa-Pro aminopeptidase n=1 Tax=Caldisalinibacter kiritimatiensis TaxID=1304284 RepID=R1CV82_9FIRM|nr:aminopeptidase P family protein [Caldisalinibacter kiritimatiensis]EOD00539.1 Xaa-Pro aminopeptidase [Caldisalinibacter kiritimatiensis]